MPVYLQPTHINGHFELEHSESKTFLDYWVFSHSSEDLKLFTLCRDNSPIEPLGDYTYFSSKPAKEKLLTLARIEGKSLSKKFGTEFIDRTQCARPRHMS